MAITDDELDARLARGRIHVRDGNLPAPVVSLLISETRVAARSKMLRTRVTAVTAAGAIVLCGIVAGPATADTVQKFLAQTVLNPATDDVASPSDEWIDTAASDFSDYVASVYPQWLPLAPGQTRQGLIASVADQLASTPALTQEVSVKRSFENAVYVGWMGEWIAANDVGDQSRMDAAIAVLELAPTWPAVAATDGGGVATLMAGFVAEMAMGDADAAQAAAQYDGNPAWDGIERDALITQLITKYIPEAL